MIEKLNLYSKKSTSSAYTLLPTKINWSYYLKMTNLSHFQYLLFDYFNQYILTAFLEHLLYLCALQILSHLVITEHKEVDIIISVELIRKLRLSDVNLPKGTQLVCDSQESNLVLIESRLNVLLVTMCIVVLNYISV